MIGNAAGLLKEATAQSVAVPAFNIDSIEMAMGILDAAARSETGLILQVTVETLNIWGWNFLIPTLSRLIEASPVAAVLMLDHAKAIEDIIRAVDLGIKAVMFDGSAAPIDQNIRLTQSVVAYARPRGCFVEGEVGHVARDGEPIEWEHLTTVGEAQGYWRATGVDALAVAVGSKHGHYRSSTDVNLDRLNDIHQAVGAPLVMHGGSGMPRELFGPLCDRGIAKVNIGTELRRAWWDAVGLAATMKPREALLQARQNVRDCAMAIIEDLERR